jgi:hypothetical protein
LEVRSAEAASTGATDGLGSLHTPSLHSQTAMAFRGLAESIVDRAAEVEHIISANAVPEELSISTSTSGARFQDDRTCARPPYMQPTHDTTVYHVYHTKGGKVVARQARSTDGMMMYDLESSQAAGAIADTALFHCLDLGTMFMFSSKEQSYSVHLETCVELAGCRSRIQHAAGNAAAGGILATCQQHRQGVKAAILQLVAVYAVNQKNQCSFEAIP